MSRHGTEVPEIDHRSWQLVSNHNNKNLKTQKSNTFSLIHSLVFITATVASWAMHGSVGCTSAALGLPDCVGFSP